MVVRFLLAAGMAIGLLASPIHATVTPGDDSAVTGGGGSHLPPYLQCVPYARRVSGIEIYGDAWTWWGQAEGRYARGFVPKVGAVMALKPHGNSHLGHVAAVSRIVNSRTILIRHANWSPINGRRGQIEDNVTALDVSLNNDWSEVRIWYAPIQALGGSRWPVQGFIYPAKPRKDDPKARRTVQAPAQVAKPAPAPAPKKAKRSKDPLGDIIGQRMGW